MQLLKRDCLIKCKSYQARVGDNSPNSGFSYYDTKNPDFWDQYVWTWPRSPYRPLVVDQLVRGGRSGAIMSTTNVFSSKNDTFWHPYVWTWPRSPYWPVVVDQLVRGGRMSNFLALPQEQILSFNLVLKFLSWLYRKYPKTSVLCWVLKSTN